MVESHTKQLSLPAGTISWCPETQKDYTAAQRDWKDKPASQTHTRYANVSNCMSSKAFLILQKKKKTQIKFLCVNV